jgi:hypothetical protein
MIAHKGVDGKDGRLLMESLLKVSVDQWTRKKSLEQ